MSKFKRLSFTENQARFPLMNEEAQKAIKGGCSICDELLEMYPNMTVYTQEEYYNFEGEWTGGIVCGLGYGLPEAVVVVYSDIPYCSTHNLPQLYGAFDDECLTCVYDNFEYCDSHYQYFDFNCLPCSSEEGYDYGYESGYEGESTDPDDPTDPTLEPDTPAPEQGNPNTESPVYNISFSGTTADRSTISAKTIGILEDIMDFTGDYSLTITSTARSIYDQARIMYDNILKSGVQHQLDTYKTPGDNVVTVYDATLSREDNIAAMVTQIKLEGSTKVSKHCADHNVLNVFDIALSSIEDSTKFKQALNKFGIYHLDENGCIHLEIPQ